MSPFILVLIAIDTPDHAQTLAKGLVENRLAACVTILPGVQSIYHWEGAVQQEAECLLLCKTTTERYAPLEAWVQANHPYKVPEMIQLPIQNGFAPYLAWVEQNVTVQG